VSPGGWRTPALAPALARHWHWGGLRAPPAKLARIKTAPLRLEVRQAQTAWGVAAGAPPQLTKKAPCPEGVMTPVFGASRRQAAVVGLVKHLSPEPRLPLTWRTRLL
jgi:hypothetical protein